MPTRKSIARFGMCLLLFVEVLPFLNAAEYSHKIWRTEDGLPQNRVQSIAQTNDGYLWLGTSEGLARFDGFRFVLFDGANTPAIKDNSISSLEASPDGSLWIGTEGGGLLHYVGETFHQLGEKDGLTNGFVRATLLDAAGTLWVGTDRGFFRYSGNQFVRLDNTADVPLASITGIARDTGGKLWASTNTGLLTVDSGKLKPVSCAHPTGVAGDLTMALLRDALIADGCGAPPAALRGLPVISVRRDASGTVWAGTIGQGLISIDGGSGAKTEYLAPSVLPDNNVFLEFEDRQHNIWAAAQDGLVRLSKAVVTTVSAKDGLGDDNVSTTYEDRNGVLWLVTFSGQIYRLQGSSPQRYYLPAPVRDLRFRNVFMDSRGDYWFGTAGSGAVRLSKGNATRYTRENGLRSQSIREIFEDSKGAIWFATGSGLSTWKGGSMRTYYLEQGLSYPSVRCLAETPEGDILAGTDAGLNRIREGHFVEDRSFAEVKQEKIWSIYIDNKSIWLGTRGGGLVLLRNGHTFRFTTRDGMASNSIYRIIDDHAGRFWLSSPVGVFSVRQSELDAVAAGHSAMVHAMAYGVSDGMATSQMYGGVQPAGVRRASGELWFPSVRGAVRMDAAHLPVRRSAPARIERVSASDVPLPISGEVAIPSGRGRVQIDFTASNMIAPRQVTFRYKLENFDDAWSVATGPRSAYYSNLPPGHYTFRVIAEDAGSENSSSEASIMIFQTPAFHQTIWFYLLLSALLVCCLATGVWLYARQTRARFAIVLHERTRVAREMHDTVIQGCVAVSTLLEAAARLQRTNIAEAAKLLADARIQIKETLDESREAVWNLRNPKTSQSPVSDLLILARKLAAQHGIQVEEHIEGEPIPLNELTDRALLLVGREALRNAVSHGAPQTISIAVFFEAGGVRMDIRDDGGGFEMKAATGESNGHFGIVGMRERVEQLGGTFHLESYPGKGTTVSLSLPAGR